MKQSLLTAELTRFFPEEASYYLTNYRSAIIKEYGLLSQTVLLWFEKLKEA
jgi:hypothetical protein